MVCLVSGRQNTLMQCCIVCGVLNKTLYVILKRIYTYVLVCYVEMNFYVCAFMYRNELPLKCFYVIY
jgi:hypothetical protein